MTVCLASIAEGNRALVVVTDQMLSSAELSLEHSTVKGDFLDWSWFSMWASEDIGPIHPIISRAKVDLLSEPRPRDHSAERVAGALAKAFQDVTRERAEAEYLSPYGWDMATFMGKRGEIPATEFRRRQRGIENHDLGVTFLVAGYARLEPYVFTVGRRGLVDWFNKPGFCVIGNGYQMAYASLALAEHNTSRTVGATLCALLEAKFAAEIAPGVGTYTTAGVMLPHNIIQIVPRGRIEALRANWEAKRTREYPPETLALVEGWWGPVYEGIRRAETERLVTFMNQISPEGPQGHPATTPDPSGQLPSPESPEGSDVP